MQCMNHMHFVLLHLATAELYSLFVSKRNTIIKCPMVLVDHLIDACMLIVWVASFSDYFQVLVGSCIIIIKPQ